MSTRLFAVLSALALPALSLAADDLSDPVAVAAAMRKANDFYVSKLAVHGGYASSWKRGPGPGRSEHREGENLISIQPPGTPTVGLAMLRAYEATGDEAFLEGARGAARALIDCQLESGGWSDDFDFGGEDAQRRFLRKQVLAGDTEKGKRANLSTLDDNKTQSAMLLLLELAHTPAGKADPELQDALRYAFDHVLAVQTRIGSWPQQFSGAAPADGLVKKAEIPAEWPREWPKEKYHGYHTLNDGNLEELVHLMLRAHELTGETRYLDSAKRCGDFLLLAQFDGDQPGWAQQYDAEMVPSWARKFEPPALSSSESYGACLTLFEIWLATGEGKYRDTLSAALDWLEKSRLSNGKWSRFYEFGTNRPLYCEAGTYRLTYDDSNLPSHYSFQSDYLVNKVERLRADLAKPREDLLASRRPPDTPERRAKAARNLREKVKTALGTQTEDGIWLDKDEISAELFVKHLNAMSAYVKAFKNS